MLSMTAYTFTALGLMKRNIFVRTFDFIKWRIFGVAEFVNQIYFERRALSELRMRWRSMSRQNENFHNLDGTLIVSLTSYPPRFSTLHLTIMSLLTQSVRPDRLMLWIAHGDLDKLPAAVTDLTQHGLEIRATDDIKSYKKIVPAKLENPGAFIATADDDVYYETDWLEQLCRLITSSRDIACHRAHMIKFTPDARLEPYTKWTLEVGAGSVLAKDIFPTGVGGILYAPQSLHDETTNIALFTELAPHADDVWLAWMGRMAGATYKLVQKPWQQVTWSRSQKAALAKRNLGSGNDIAIASMATKFGALRP